VPVKNAPWVLSQCCPDERLSALANRRAYRGSSSREPAASRREMATRQAPAASCEGSLTEKASESGASVGSLGSKKPGLIAAASIIASPAPSERTRNSFRFLPSCRRLQPVFLILRRKSTVLPLNADAGCSIS